MDAYDITASALTAQRLRMDAISSNLANINTTRQENGSIGAYHRKNVIFAPIYDNAVNQSQGSDSGMVTMGPDGRPLLKIGVQNAQFTGAGVKVLQIVDDTKTPMRKVYDPSH